MRSAIKLLLAALAFTLGGSGVAHAANQLAGHPSPYLALHANDPVGWQSWQANVFAQARASNRLVLVSVGYFSCHWCHVMQRESYQDPQVAALLNQHFISVKVDRELEPDLDQRLLDFVKQVRGAAGWPLNVILTPEGYPLTGFTYLPRDNFLHLLERLDVEWQQNHAELSASAREFFELSATNSKDQDMPHKLPADVMVDAFVTQTMQSADQLAGGFGSSSKFPNVPQLDALLASLQRAGKANDEVAEFIQLSLQAMAAGNLLDHLNGGFFRYTTDPDWRTPHFEKMLYDNALLASLYLKAHQVWPEQGYAAQALATLDFVEARLKHPQGGYMSSLSAVDSDDQEGGAYLWTAQQLASLLDATELEFLQQYWQQDPVAGKVLLRPVQQVTDSKDSKLDRVIRRKLQNRDVAEMPVDNKRLASWNAMMLDALTRAADHQPSFFDRAKKLFADMRKLFVVDGSLIRFADHAETAAAVFEDYAQSAQAFYRYGLRFDDSQAIELARQLTEHAHRLFLRQGRWQAKEQPLIPITNGRWVIGDLVSFSPMTLWLDTALSLPKLDPEIRASATLMLQRATREMINRPYHYGSFIMLRAQHSG